MFAGLKRRRKNSKSLRFLKRVLQGVFGKLSTIVDFWFIKNYLYLCAPNPVDGFDCLPTTLKKG
jgi:hypothetical protein